MSEEVKWGIIGPGKIARSFAMDFQFVQSGELVGVASRSIERANSFADQFGIKKRYGSYDEMLLDSGIDAIYIATPHNFHFEQTKAALLAGKSVLCEKPITTSPTELKELLKIHSKSGTFLMEGMWTYFLPAILKTQEWISADRIGKIKEVKANFGFPAKFDPKGRLFNPDLAGGAVFDLGIYPLAISTLILGEHPVSVKSNIQRSSTGVDDDVMMELTYEDNSVASLHCSFRTELSNSAEILGDKGRITIPLFWKGKECTLSTKNGELVYFNDGRSSHGYDFEIESASQAILSGKSESQIIPLSNSLVLQKLMSRVLTS